ncbi:MAG: cyclic pyranopterin monophosphate synthase MoaC [SAR202 cluster bacterium]|nr:cyclic pyranopterin monophosphate synthase MoaC [SAR202 cluster bacterium]HAE32408.1 cyclic pyranopterin monophosphate synthase MoaC [Dehalococcoidia bacterium]
MITIYTDGACLGNPGPGGWGAVITGDGIKRSVHGSDPHTTNNRMEIMAVVEGLRNISDKSEVAVFSDSTYVINTMTKNWKRNKNKDLWNLLDQEVTSRAVSWHWVKGHSGDLLNEEADRLAYGEATGKFGLEHEPFSGEGLMEADKPEPTSTKDDILTHIDKRGAARMVDVGAKPDSDRVAVAIGFVEMKIETLQMIKTNEFKKGDVLSVARIAGIMGAKQTPGLIPLCHPLPLTQVTVDFELDEERSRVEIRAMAKTHGKTGVEIEALTATSIAALTIYDMCKAVDRGMQISTRLLSKTGGQSGDVFLE